MHNLNLTDKELLHYQELYNMDPVVQRLCRIQFEEIHELQDRNEELTEEVDDLECRLQDKEDYIQDLKRNVRILEEKIKVWRALEEE